MFWYTNIFSSPYTYSPGTQLEIVVKYMFFISILCDVNIPCIYSQLPCNFCYGEEKQLKTRCRKKFAGPKMGDLGPKRGQNEVLGHYLALSALVFGDFAYRD